MHTPSHPSRLTHLQRLEAESIHIMREVVAEADKPVMLYSIGKDSAVMLHLAQKAFYPAPPPFPLLHVDTTWKFRDMYALRERMARESGMELLVHAEPRGAWRRASTPSTTARRCTPTCGRPQGLKQALDQLRLRRRLRRRAAATRRRSRAKERIFSLPHRAAPLGPEEPAPRAVEPVQRAQAQGRVDPRLPALATGPSSTSGSTSTWRTSPSCRSTSPAERPVVERDGTLIMVDDERMPLQPGEAPMMKQGALPHAGLLPAVRAPSSPTPTRCRRSSRRCCWPAPASARAA
ncbi:MAG: phosphoadenosine phosphosulfate reductase family protein [Comamonadaceae bacterium]|nr:phosphoadenosine phosphosulfate reductase family protein [Comamonadaceae bacterium]